jgi:pheromone a factor receptor
MAVPLASLAQMRRLESLASTRQTIVTAVQQRNRIWGEILMCFGLPILMLPIQYIAQGHRFDLTETTGCTPTLFFSWPGIAIRFVLPLVISFASFVYAGECSRHQ